MFGLLYDYFYNLFGWLDSSGTFADIFFVISDGGVSIYLDQYLSLLCSIISLIVIIILCCLFIYRLIRVVGRLFMGA